tara:strand:+ start:13 stop:972 length:960 start_codon:yes stop_codon:yes gene_type:complete
MEVTIKKIDLYGDDTNPKTGVANAYPTPKDAVSQPCLMYVSAVRNSGKSYSISKLVRQCKKDKTFDVIYMITPTFVSNKSYFGDMVDEENVFEPTKSSIQEVIAKVEQDRDEYEAFMERKKEYIEFIKCLKKGTTFTDEELLKYIDMGFFEDNLLVPKWKYAKEQPPRSLLILDDVLSSPALLQSSGLTKVATLNRHIAPLKEEFTNPDGTKRSACGLAVIIISQTYSMSQGVSRCLRENLTHLMIFKNKQEKQLSKIREELGSAVDEDKFMKAYEYATKERYGNLLVDFKPNCPTKTFRKNLNELIIFKEDLAECQCH